MTLDLEKLYAADYMDAHYGDQMHETFTRISQLPHGQSDNTQRVGRVCSFVQSYMQQTSGSLLDIGSGLGVFPHAMDRSGWTCTALEPDPRAARHLAETLQLNVVNEDFFNTNIADRYDLITLNKVLEHVHNPIAMLMNARKYLRESGLVYVELPDAEMAMEDSQFREEFLIEHLHVFSMISAATLARQAGFVPLKIERLVEPSSKYTIFMFLCIRESADKSDWR